MKNELIEGKFSVGYDRQIVTPALGTWLGGYGNGCDRGTIGKIFDDDDLFVTAVVMTDAKGESILAITVDLVRMPVCLFRSVRTLIVGETGIKEQNITMSATHSHSAPDARDDTPEMKPWYALYTEKCLVAVRNALADRKPAEIYVGTGHPENLNFVRRYMLNGEFLGTNAKGDAHETKSDNNLQIVKFVREGGEDVVLCNWGAHPDHSKTIGGESGTPEFHRGCSADYIYSLRKNVEAKAGVKFAFYQAAAGNLNPSSRIPGESQRLDDIVEKEGKKRYVAYGELLADEVMKVLNAPLTKISAGDAKGIETSLTIQKPKGFEIGSRDYNIAYAINVITFAKRTLEKPTEESREGAMRIIEKFELGDMDNVNKIVTDKDHPFYTHALCAKVLYEGGKMPFTNEYTRKCASALCNLFGYKSGPYGTNGLLLRAHNTVKSYDIPLYALSCGDLAFACAPAEIFDTNGMEVKNASPFKFTFYCEQTGGSTGYYPSKLAWSHGGYELQTTSAAEGSAERISEKLLEMLNTLKKD